MTRSVKVIAADQLATEEREASDSRIEGKTLTRMIPLVAITMADELAAKRP